VLLADEINRTPPKTQAALLQAMQEGEVTIGCETHRLAPPFFVLATQNPIEMEGVYPLPEAQLDRFLCCVRIAYPSHEEEVTIATTGPAAALGTVLAVLGPDQINELQRAVRAVPVARDVAGYAVRIVSATRPGQNGASISGLTEYLDCGGSPRASQALIAMAKARALLHGRVHVDFADIRALAPEVLRHRLILNFRARAEKLDADVLVNRALEQVKTEAA
jgi:MoxR-like ATPase